MIYNVGDEEETKNQKGMMGCKERIYTNDKTTSKPRNPRKILGGGGGGGGGGDGGDGGVGKPASITLGRNKLGRVITYVFSCNKYSSSSKEVTRSLLYGLGSRIR